MTLNFRAAPMIPPIPSNVELFISLFHGRSDAYARRWEKEGRSGYSPAYAFNWDEFMAHKRQGGSLKDFQNKTLLPLTQEVITKHLTGVHVVGIYPILPDNTSYFLAADFDGANWLNEAVAFIDASSRLPLNAYLERSRSGNGGHVWIFFSEPYPCYKSRQIGLEIVRRAFDFSEFDKEISFDRLFPNQDTLSKAGFGNLIALPLQGTSISEGNTLFLDLPTAVPVYDQWTFLREAKRHSMQELDEVHHRLFVQNTSSIVTTSPSERSLTVSVSNQIVVSRSALTPALVSYLKEELNFLNSEYFTKRRLGISTYKVPKYFKLIEESGDTVSIPRGFLNRLTTFLTDHDIVHSLRFDHSSLDETSFKSCIAMTPLQTKTINAVLQHDQGVIVAPSGSGKTIIGLELVARRKRRALILVHRKQLLDQWVERIQQFLGIPKAHIGEYSGNKKKIGEQVTVALLQSLSRRNDLSEFKNTFGTILVDECHHIPASTFREVVAQLNCHYLYGLTATPERKHNDEKLIYVYIGDIVGRMETTDFQPASIAPNQPVDVIVRETHLAIPFTFSTDLFQLLAKVVCFDTARNQLIVADIVKEASLGRKVLVLSERKEHLAILNLYLKGKSETIVISGEDSLRARKSKVAQIEAGHYQVILSTGQFFGEGIDIRGVTCLILAFPFSFEGKLVQYIGRLRDSGEKRVIIDYRDKNIPFLERQFKLRKRHYRKTPGTKLSEVTSELNP